MTSIVSDFFKWVGDKSNSIAEKVDNAFDNSKPENESIFSSKPKELEMMNCHTPNEIIKNPTSTIECHTPIKKTEEKPKELEMMNCHTPEQSKPAVNNNAEEYTVKKGDCLWNIAKQSLENSGETASNSAISEMVNRIAKDNNIENPDLIYPDQVFKINKNATPVENKNIFSTEQKQPEMMPSHTPNQSLQTQEEIKNPTSTIECHTPSKKIEETPKQLEMMPSHTPNQFLQSQEPTREPVFSNSINCLSLNNKAEETPKQPEMMPSHTPNQSLQTQEEIKNPTSTIECHTPSKKIEETPKQPELLNCHTPEQSKPAVNNNAEEYTVKKGDCLWNIAKRSLENSGETASNSAISEMVNKIAKDNNIKNPDLIYPDQVFKINKNATPIENKEKPKAEENKKTMPETKKPKEIEVIQV